MDSTHAERFLRGGAGPQLRDAPDVQKLARIVDLFSNPSSFERSAFCRRYMAPHKCAQGVALLFWKRQRLICTIAILRTSKQGDFSPAELKLVRQLYPQFLAALRRIESLERVRSVRVNFQQFLQRLPLPTMVLRWNLKPIYQNPAARDFYAVWEKGPEEAKRTKANSPIPSEISDRCSVLKQQWSNAQRQMRSGRQTKLIEEQVHHPHSRNLRETIQLTQVKSASVARPHFLIACEDPCHGGAGVGRPELFVYRPSPDSHAGSARLRSLCVKAAATKRSHKMPV